MWDDCSVQCVLKLYNCCWRAKDALVTVTNIFKSSLPVDIGSQNYMLPDIVKSEVMSCHESPLADGEQVCNR